MGEAGAPTAPLTVVSAAAGSGKTTAVRSWTDGLGAGVADVWRRAPRPRARRTPAPAVAGPAARDAGRAGDRVRVVGGSRRRGRSGRARRAARRADRRRPGGEPAPAADDRHRRPRADRRRDRADPDDRVTRPWRSAAAADRARHAYVTFRSRSTVSAMPMPSARSTANRCDSTAQPPPPSSAPDGRDGGSRTDDLVSLADGHPATLVMAAAAARRGGADVARRADGRRRGQRRLGARRQPRSSPPSIPTSVGSSTMRSCSTTRTAPSWRPWGTS